MYTVKQRNEIYRKAYAMLIGKNAGCLAGTYREGDWILNRSGICELLYIAPQKKWDGSYCDGDERSLGISYPELPLFESGERHSGGFWLPKEDRKTRLTILAFCIAMTDSDKLQP